MSRQVSRWDKRGCPALPDPTRPDPTKYFLWIPSFIRFGPFQRRSCRMNAGSRTKPQVGGRTIAALAHVIAEIRGATGATPWQPEGVAPALVEAIDNPACTSLQVLAFAAIRAAVDPKNRTPAIIARDGRHWHEHVAGETTAIVKHYPRCQCCKIEMLPRAGVTREEHHCPPYVIDRETGQEVEHHCTRQPERGATSIDKAALRAQLAEQTKAFQAEAEAAKARELEGAQQ